MNSIKKVDFLGFFGINNQKLLDKLYKILGMRSNAENNFNKTKFTKYCNSDFIENHLFSCQKLKNRFKIKPVFQF